MVYYKFTMRMNIVISITFTLRSLLSLNCENPKQISG